MTSVDARPDPAGSSISVRATTVSAGEGPTMSDGERDAAEGHEEVFVVPIGPSIDLHHFQPGEVLAVVDAYLDAAIERGIFEVRLIHGRGRGVQRARVQQRLSADPRVERYADAPAERGGWGATLAWLRPGETRRGAG